MASYPIKEPTQLEEVAYVTIDPGEGKKDSGSGGSGWATFDETGEVLEIGQYPLEDQTRMLKILLLRTPNLKAIICEDYKNHGWQAQKRWSRNQTSKNIGKIEAYAELRSIPCHLQPNTIKGIGYMWAGITPPKNHAISHQYDAYVHGVYWLQQNGIRKAGLAIPEDER